MMTEQIISHRNNYGKTELRSLDSFSVEDYFANNANLITDFWKKWGFSP